MNVTTSTEIPSTNNIGHNVAPDATNTYHETQPAVFNNPQIAKESFLAKAKTLFTAHHTLPKLGEKQLIKGLEILSKTRVLKGRDEAFEITFTLAELFHFLQSKGGENASTAIDNIELIGGAVPAVLDDYVYPVLSSLGIENPEEMVSAELLRNFAKTPKDYDFRICVPKGSCNDILYMRSAIVEFFMSKKTQENPNLDVEVFRSLLLQKGFNNFTTPKEDLPDLMSTVGFMDSTTNLGIDIVIYKNLQRDSLFIQDDLRLNMIQIINVLKHQSAAEAINMMKAKFLELVIIPASSFGNGCQALFDKLAGILRADDIPSINCAGWGIYLMRILKGNRGSAPALEKALFDKIHRSLIGKANKIDLPKALFDKLTTLSKKASSQTRMATAAAFWLEKVLDAHIGKDPTAALVLTLQACVSLKKNGYEGSVDELWIFMKERAAPPTDNTLCTLIHQAMDNPKAFDKVIALLEVKALLQMQTSDPKDPSFAPDLIMHNQKPALQINIGGYSLLLPYHGENGVPNLIMACAEITPELNQALEQLDACLASKTPYQAHSAAPINYIPADFTLFWERAAAEWILASGVMLEESFPDLLSHYPDKAQRVRLIESAENLCSLQDKKIYTTMRHLCTKEDYAQVSMPLVWAMALTALNDPARCRAAFLLWKTHFSAIPNHLKTPFAKVLVNKISTARLDLAIEILIQEDFPFADGMAMVRTIRASYQNNPLFQSEKNLLLISKAVEKIYKKGQKALDEEVLKVVRWNIGELIRLSQYAKAFELAETLGISPNEYIEYLEWAPTDSWLEVAAGFNERALLQPATASRLEGILCLLLAFKQPKASQWKQLFEKIKTSPNKEICINAWKGLCACLNTGLQGSLLEAAEAWITALKTISMHQPHLIMDLLGKEGPFLTLFADPSTHPLREKACLMVYENLLDQWPEVCPDEKKILLLNFRKNMAFKLQQSADLRLAKVLTASTAVPLQIEAFKLYVELGQDSEAQRILQPLFQSSLSKEAQIDLSAAFLPLFPRLLKEKTVMSWKLLSAPSLEAMLKLNSREAIEILLQWIDQEGEADLETTCIVLNLLLSLPLLTEESFQAACFAAKTAGQLQALNALPKKFDLKPILEKCHQPLVRLLATHQKYATLYTLLSAVKQLGLDVPLNPYLIECYYDMFFILMKSKMDLSGIYHQFIWFKSLIGELEGRPKDSLLCFELINKLAGQGFIKEAEALIPEFLANLDQGDIGELEVVSASGCHLIMRCAFQSQDEKIIETAWLLFWIHYIDLNQDQAVAAQSWEFILESIEPVLPQALLLVLNDIEKFAKSISFLPEKERRDNIEKLLLDSAVSICKLNETGQADMLPLWIQAQKFFEQEISPDIYVANEVNLSKNMLFFVAGDREQYRCALDLFTAQIKECPEDLETFLHLTRLLTCIFAAPPSARLKSFLESEPMQLYVSKTCKVLHTQDVMPKEVRILYSAITDLYSPEGCIFKVLCQIKNDIPCMWEFVCLSVLDILRNEKELSQEHRISFSELLESTIKTAAKEKRYFSLDFVLHTMNPPFLEKGMVDSAERLSNIYYHILGMNLWSGAAAADKTDNRSIMIASRHLYLKQVKENISFFVEHAGLESFNHVFNCLSSLSILNDGDFSNQYKSLMSSITKFLNAKYDKKQAQLCEFKYRLKLIFEFLDYRPKYAYRPHYAAILKKTTDFLFKEFEVVINMKEVDKNPFSEMFHLFALYPYIHVPDELYWETNKTSFWESHNEKLKRIVIKAYNAKLLNDPQKTFQYKLLLRISSIKMHFSHEDEIQAFQNFLTDFLFEPTYYKVKAVILLLSDVLESVSLCRENVLYGWIRVFRLAAIIKPLHETYLFQLALCYLFESQLLAGPGRSMEWSETSARICKAAFEELSHPVCCVNKTEEDPQADVCLSLASFLKSAITNHCFDGQGKIYFQLVDQLLTLIEQLNKTQNEEFNKRLKGYLKDIICPSKEVMQSCDEDSVKAMLRAAKISAKLSFS